MGKAGIVIPQHETRRYGPGESIERTIPGDFLLTHGDSGNSALIRFGQTLRYRGGSKHFAHWTHAGLFVSEDGMIVEAVQSGVQERSVRAYHSAEYHVIHLTEASEEGRKNAVNFAMHCLHDRYGFLTDISITMMLLTASTLCFGVDGQMICSGLVARALERTGAIFQYDSWHMMPADLAEAFNVIPEPGASKGAVPALELGVTRRSH